MNPPTSAEVMIVSTSRALRGARSVFVGVGPPNIAANLARRTHSPELELVYESGVFGARPSRLPLSIGDPCLVTGATSVCSMADLFMFYLQRGLIDVGLLGAAQIDRFGNINTTVVGDYHHPKVRLPGSGGGCEIAILTERVLVIMRQSKRSFIEKIDFCTSPGFLTGGDSRARLNLPGKGPEVVITDLGVYRFDATTHEMTLVSVHPGVTVEQVRANTEWNLHVADDLAVTEEPTVDELRLIREELDPQRLYTK
jgi:glutaconate CoA-transferase subunit B